MKGDGVTIWEALTRKWQRWKANLGDLGRRGLGETFLLLFPLSLAQIFFLCAFVQLWVLAVVMQVWCSKVQKSNRRSKSTLLLEEPRPERSILVRASRELHKSWELALLTVFKPSVSADETIAVLPCRFTCML